MSSQTPHIMRLLITAFVLGIPEHKVRVISPDVGGAFGTKIFLYTEWVLVMLASKRLGGRPVKWVESRRENYVGTTHGRDHVTEHRDRGHPRRHRHGPVASRPGPTWAAACRPSPRASRRRSTGACSRAPMRSPTSGVRSPACTPTPCSSMRTEARAGRRRPTSLERAMDLFAAEIGMDRAEIRRATSCPATASRIATRAASIAPGTARSWPSTRGTTSRPWSGRSPWRATRTSTPARRRPGRAAGCLGLGISSYIEICGVAPSKWIGAVGEGWGAAMWESANIRVHLTGKVVVTTGSQTQGQGHETTHGPGRGVLAGRARGRRASSSTRTPSGRRSATARTGRARGPWVAPPWSRPRTRSRRRRSTVAAHLLEAAVEDIEVEAGRYFVKGSPDRAKTLGEIAFATDLGFDLPEGVEPFLDETAYYDMPNCTWPFGTHIAIVEVDQETGHVELVRYIAVDDVGRKINPLIVDGQLHGGIAQGVGQALWEGAVYDANGQLLSGSMLDYALPRASWLPGFELDETVTPSPVNPLGVKGVGEAGAIASTPAAVNAVHRRARAPGRPASRHAPHLADRLARHRRRGGDPRMIPAAVRLHPARVHRGGAAHPRAAGDPGTKVISGGMSLLPLLKLRLAEVGTLVDIGRLAELHGIRELADGGVVIGSAVTYREVLESALVAERAPLLTEVIHDIGDVQVRNRGTLGGILAHADPASDIPAAVLALDAMLALRPSRGSGPGPWTASSWARSIPPSSPRSWSSRSASRRSPRGPGRAYRQLTQPASGYSMVGVAAVVARTDGAVAHARVAITGVGDVAYRARAVEDRAPGLRTAPRDAIAAAAATRPTASRSTATSTRTRRIAARWRSCSRDAPSRRRWHVAAA